jgi:hypothetical protein
MNKVEIMKTKEEEERNKVKQKYWFESEPGVR